MKGRIFLFLFGLPFFGVGAWMAWSIGSTVVDAAHMKHWVPVEATLQDAGYRMHSGEDSDTYEAYARYGYTYRGRRWTGSRVTPGSGGDNIGDYQQDTGRRLAAARSRGESVEVWVDPQHPQRSIIDRDIRWGMIGFESIFVVVFGGAGLGLLIWSWRAPTPKDKSDPRYEDAPWLADDAWQTATIRSSSKTSMYGAWVFAVFWNAISAPIPFLAYGEIVERHNYVVLIGLLFPLVGIGLLVWALRRTLEWRRFGPAPVTLDPFPGSIGGHVGGSIDLRLPFDPTAKFRVTLTNLHSAVSGSSKDRSRSEKALWQDGTLAHVESCGLGTRLVFRFDVPEGLGESDTEHDDSYKLWRLSLEAELPGTDLDRSYEIPVYATARRSNLLSERAVAESRDAQHAIDVDAVRERMHLGYGVTGRREMRLDNIKTLRKSSNMQAQSGGKYTMFYNVSAIDYIGNKLTLGEGFRGESEANAAMALIRREFGIRKDEDVRGANPLDDDYGLDRLATNN